MGLMKEMDDEGKLGYKTRTIYQNNPNKGEKVHIKISKN